MQRVKNSNNPKVKEIADDLEKVSAVSALAESDGGKVLVKGLNQDIISCVDTLCVKYKDLTVQEFIALCSEMKTKLDMVRALSRAKKNKEFLEEMLEESLKEE